MTAWIEAWVSPGTEPPFILLVIPTAAGRVAVIDPQHGRSIAYESQDYEDVKTWLLEDEFEKIDGRTPLV